MAGVNWCYPLFRFGPEGDRLLGIYSTSEKAREALNQLPELDDCEFRVEEWPLDERATRFNISVEASK